MLTSPLFSDAGVVREHSQWEKAFAPISTNNSSDLFSNFGCSVVSQMPERDCESVVTAITEQVAADVWNEVIPYIAGERQQHPKTSYGTRTRHRAKVTTANPRKRAVKMDVLTAAPSRARGPHRRSRSIT